MKRAALGLLLLASPLAAQTDVAYEIDAPEMYRVWYHEARTCLSHMEPLGGFDALTFIVVPGIGWEAEDGAFVLGQFYAPSTIYLAEAYADAAWLVRHEVLHYLLQPDAEHPSPPFRVCEGAPDEPRATRVSLRGLSEPHRGF